MTLSDRIMAARKAKNWTQTDLANALQVNVKNISRWELAQAKPSIEAAAQLAQALEVSLDFLAGLDDGKTSPLELLFKQKKDKLSHEQVKALVTVLEAF